jgi:hypothetical protein
VLPTVAGSVSRWKQRERAACEGAGVRGEGWVAFSMPRMHGKTNSMPVESPYVSWQWCTMAWTPRPELNVSRMRELTETLTFPGLYFSMHTSIAQSPLLNIVELHESYNIA